jgi:hypothetical protein
MKSETELRQDGLRALISALGPVEAERFITLILREPFDYTNWQKRLWTEMSVEEISKAAMKLRKGRSKPPNKPTSHR